MARRPRLRRAVFAAWLLLGGAAGGPRANNLTMSQNVPNPSMPDRCVPVTDVRMRPGRTVPKPGYLQSFVDPIFGSRVTRITGDPGTPIPVVGGTWGHNARHNHAKDSVWNADQTLMVLKNIQGIEGHAFLDGTSYEPRFVTEGPGGETRWHPSVPEVMTYVRPDCVIGHWNVRTNATTARVMFEGYSSCSLGPWEGNASADGRWLAVSATRRDDRRLVAFVVDVDSGKRYPDLDLVANGITSLDWVGTSASGRYIVVNGTIAGCARVADACDATRIFSREGAQVGPFWSEYGRPSHYDLTVDASGDEVAVGVAKSGPAEGKVIMRRLIDGAITAVSPGGYSQHHSARNTGRPGWAYVSHPYNGPNWPPFRNEVFAVKLGRPARVERIAQLAATTPTYESQPQVVPSPDGARVVFASNWGSDSGPVQTYVADTRPPCRAVKSSTFSNRKDKP